MGTPTIMIEHGKIIQDNFYKVRYDINDLLEQCRTNGYYDISDIEYAIVEANGQLSILPTANSKPVTIKDMNLKVKKQGLCANIIIDGKIMHKKLELINKTEEWLLSELKIKGKILNNILLATVDINEKIIFYERNKGMNVLNVLE